MNIQTTHKEYAITLTYKCNWNCDYCAVRNPVDWKDIVTPEDVFGKISKIEPGSTVTLFGGEPGMLTKEDLVRYMDALFRKDCRLLLETNGLFIRRYPELLADFDKITYHCSQNLSISDEVMYVDHPNVDYMLVISDKNVLNLGKFLETHPNPERFHMVEATYPHGNTGPTLTSENKYHVMTAYASRMTKESIQELFHGRNLDRIIFMT